MNKLKRETKIYIGLNDSETHEQKFDTERYTNILKQVCKSYSDPFSFTVSEGGYMHEDGSYTQEKSLILLLIDVDKETINEMAKDLCVFFHQESVMITEDQVRTFFVKERLE